jgi:hypothetical protein
MTPDQNKVHFLINVRSLLIPQRMISFNKEEKVNFVKWYYSRLSFRDMQATFPAFYPERPIPSLTCQISYIVIFGCQCCHLGYTSQLLLFCQILLFFHYCVLPEDVKKQKKLELGTIFKTLQFLYLGFVLK